MLHMLHIEALKIGHLKKCPCLYGDYSLVGENIIKKSKECMKQNTHILSNCFCSNY